ncbi:MAG: glycerol dehydrogenase [Oscillospiraceae bacterium]|jgi:glycerol dehydrogenase|nr:glycerol dehydrogenase [Oscillospiraceae bacterium]
MTILRSPSKYVQGKNELSNLYFYASAFAKRTVFAIVDPFVIAHYEPQIKSSFAGKELALLLETFRGECSKSEVERLQGIIKETGAEVVVGVGGGKTLDTAKAVAYYAQLPVIICPTIASTDAPCSALSVLYHDNGTFDQYLFLRQNPNVVLVDTQIIVKAPVRMLVAGMGDALATYFEARASIRANAPVVQDGYATNAAFALSERCYEILLEDGFQAAVAVSLGQLTKSVENIIEANTYLSGIGFESCGLAAAHAIHNGLTVLPGTHAMVHGEKVAFGTIAQLVLENAPEEELDEVIAFCKRVSLPTTFAQLGIKSPGADEIMAVAEASCAEGETIHNMPFPVTPADVCAAILVADRLGQ